jgi:hypothetical protein
MSVYGHIATDIASQPNVRFQKRPRRPTTGAAEKGHKRTRAIAARQLFDHLAGAR